MLHEHGCEVHVAAKNNLSEKNGLKLDFADKVYNIPFSRSPKSYDNIKAYKMLKKIIDNDYYDVIHCNTPMGGIISRLAARDTRKKGTKIFYTAHGFHFYKGGSKSSWLTYYPIEKYFANHYTDKLITIVNEDYETVKNKDFNIDIYRTHGVGFNSKRYFPVSLEEKNKLRDEFGYNQNDFIGICTGELNKNKNQFTLIDCVPKILQMIPNFKLLLAGNGPEHDNLENQIKELQLENCVFLLGYRTDLDKYVKLSDIGISVSIREGLPLNLLENMACGKPVVGSDNRGHRDYIINNKNGFIVDKLNIKDDLINVISYIYENKDLSNLLNNAIETAKLYSDFNTEKELEKIYFGANND